MQQIDNALNLKYSVLLKFVFYVQISQRYRTEGVKKIRAIGENVCENLHERFS